LVISYLRNFYQGIINQVTTQTATQMGNQAADVATLASELASSPNVSFPTQGGMTNSRSFVSANQQIAYDLAYLFNLYNTLSQVSADNTILLDGQVADIQRGIAQLALMPAPMAQAYNHVAILNESLLVPRWMSTGTISYTDGDGTVYGQEVMAGNDYGLTLTPFINRDCVCNGDQILVTPVMGHVVGNQLSQTNAPLSSVVDQGVSCWQETVWAQMPLNLAPGIAFDVGPDDIAFYGNASGGAFCEFWLDFKYPQLMSEVILTPASTYPVNIVSVLLYETQGGTWQQISTGCTLKDTQVIRFPLTSCAQLRFLVQQLHYEHKAYQLSTDQLNEQNYEQYATEDLWFPDITSAVERDMQETCRGFAGLEQPTATQSVTYTPYEYQYGLREIDVREKQYLNIGLMLSRTYSISGDVRAVQLTTDEEDPTVNGLTNVTSIDYDIYADGGWYPIQPMDTPVVERLFGASTTLRFSVASGLALYCNGLPYTNYTFDGVQTVTINNYNGYSFYTASYTPNNSAYTLELPQVMLQPVPFTTNGLNGEYFTDGTDANGVIVLSHTPYLDYSNLISYQSLTGADVPEVLTVNSYTPLHVMVQQDDGTYLEYMNATDYVTGSMTVPDDSQYIQQGSQVILATEIVQPIIVYYDYMGGNIQMRAILRRNINGYNSLTPALNSYQLKFFVTD
jgi:hypothetical protein